MRFMLYTVCKTLRLSLFNKELFDWLLPTLKLYFGFLNNRNFCRGRHLLSRAAFVFRQNQLFALFWSMVQLYGIITSHMFKVINLCKNVLSA